jgi:ribosome maturation factor RimP
VENKVKALIEEPLNAINIKLSNVEYVKEGSMYFLRVEIDKEPFVDVDTCVKATEIINPLIDTIEDEFDDAYVLDVCSKEKGDK